MLIGCDGFRAFVLMRLGDFANFVTARWREVIVRVNVVPCNVVRSCIGLCECAIVKICLMFGID